MKGNEKQVKYILSAGVITGFGTWKYDPLTVDEAQNFVTSGDFTSAIGYAETAQVLSEIVGVEVPVNRILVDLMPGDQALVIRAKGGYRFNPADKGNLTPDFIRDHIELGLLQRL